VAQRRLYCRASRKKTSKIVLSTDLNAGFRYSIAVPAVAQRSLVLARVQTPRCTRPPVGSGLDAGCARGTIGSYRRPWRTGWSSSSEEPMDVSSLRSSAGAFDPMSVRAATGGRVGWGTRRSAPGTTCPGRIIRSRCGIALRRLWCRHCGIRTERVGLADPRARLTRRFQRELGDGAASPARLSRDVGTGRGASARTD
jgi:hypothetical protein